MSDARQHGRIEAEPFHWVRLGLLVATAIGLAAGAAGATNQDSWVVVAMWVGSGLAGLGAAVDVVVWRFHRPKEQEPIPQVIEASTIDAEPELFAPTIVQGDRPGWRAFCADGGSQQQPHGAVLYITSVRETARDFRCLVLKDGQDPATAHLRGGKVGQHAAHYPAAFPGAPPVSEGQYTFEWFGYVDNEPNELLLASGTFRVNNHLQVFCDPPRET